MSEQRRKTASELREIVFNDLRSNDDAARAAFEREYGNYVPDFVDATISALDLWGQFRDTIDDTDGRRITISALAFTSINLNISSYKLFMSGHTVASASLFRQVLEGVSLAFLCSAKSLTVLDRFIEDKYSIKKAVTEIAKHAKRAHVNRRALQTLIDQYEFYHQYAHLTKLTIAATASISQGGIPVVGAHFDPGKAREYGKEARSRVSFAKILPDFMRGITESVASW